MLELKVKVLKYVDLEKDGKRLSFMERDILCAMKELNMDKPLLVIPSYEGSQKEKKETIKEVLDLVKDLDCVVTAPAYVSIKEFPATEYTMDKRKEPNKKKLPIGKTLKRENSMLESLGFININDYVNYEFQTAFVYGNENGKEIRKYIDELLTKDK